MDVITTAIYGGLIRAATCVDALASLGCTVTHVEVGGGKPRMEIDTPCAQLSSRATLRRTRGPGDQFSDTWMAEFAGCMVTWRDLKDAECRACARVSRAKDAA